MEITNSKTPLTGNNIVTVKVPASVAYNFEAITKVTQSVLTKVGCQGCHSGRDIRIVIEDNFFADEKLNVFANPGLQNEIGR